MERDIIVCLDGTNNQAETQNTSVHRIIEVADKTNAVGFYASGVGVGGRTFGNLLDFTTGRGGFRIMRDAFNFVSHNRQPESRIFIFGFSRGAYFARHLAGMINRVGFGIPLKSTFERYLEVILSGSAQGSSRQPVHLLGLFDCVPGNQIYMLRRKLKPLNDPLLEPGILHFRHAVSQSERRWSFRPLLFQNGGQQTFEQRWFPGYHSDIGGDQSDGLNNFVFTWMLREAFGLGLEVTNWQCPGSGVSPHHTHVRVSSALPWIYMIDSEARGLSSDYFSTKLGMRWNRPLRHSSEPVNEPPKLEDMDSCPRGCGTDLFDFFATDEGRRRYEKMMNRTAAGNSR